MKTPDLFPQSLQHQALGRADLSLRRNSEFAAGALRDLVSLVMPKSHRNDPHTSVDAAQSVKEVSKQHRIATLTALALYGPATGYELADRLGLTYIQVAKRLTELYDKGKGPIERIHTDVPGVYQTRKTPSGRQACVWRVVRA